MQIRQGDVLLSTMTELPLDVRIIAKDIIVLADTEHGHVIDSRGAELLEASSGCYLRLLRPTVLPHAEHAPVTLAPGIYRVVVQRTYRPHEETPWQAAVARIGYKGLLIELWARPVSTDAAGALYRVILPPDEEPVVLVNVMNATPRPDGTRRPFLLRVPPNTQRARQGVAWTFGLAEHEYAPEVEA